MLLPISWLKEYVPKLPSVQTLVDRLMMHGLEVEEVIDRGEKFDQVVVGEIIAIEPHPQADKVRLASVVTKSGSPAQEIVCGGTNIAVGQKVAVAQVGATLPNGLTIESRVIRGITSNGMICSDVELGLGTSQTGILVLDPKLQVGTPFAAAMGFDDVVLDIATPANRSDVMAVRGLAWEISAILGKSVAFSKVDLNESKNTASASIKLSTIDQQLCPLLTARVIRGVSMVPSPDWLIQHLRASGMRSVNVIVDVTNYIMLEYGQPLHAYDAMKVHGPALIARPATSGEQLTTLDGKTRRLTSDTLVIADADHVIGIAGVMGGRDTEVSNSTTDIILEAAIFNPVSIRQTSRSLGLVSEASKRFEKGLWSNLPEQASAAAAALLVRLCGGTVEQGSVRVGTGQSKATSISMDPGYISERLGTKVSVAKCKTTLVKLGFGVKGTTTEWTVTVPEWRLDVSLPEDIVDEVGRLAGYTALPHHLPPSQPATKELPPAIRFKEEVKNMLVDLGYAEVVSHAFYSDDNSRIVTGDHFEVANPLDATQHKLRKSLLPQLDEILKREADAGHDAEIFEIGQVFDPNRAGPVDRQQSWKLALGVTYKGEELFKKTIAMLQKKLSTTTQPESLPVSSVLVRGRRIESCEFDLSVLMTASKKVFGPWDPDRHSTHQVKVRELSKYPAITRDIAFWWPNNEQSIRQAISALNLDVLREFNVKDRFVKDGKTSYAYTFTYQSSDRTLTKTEVDALEQLIKDILIKQGATIR